MDMQWCRSGGARQGFCDDIKERSMQAPWAMQAHSDQDNSPTHQSRCQERPLHLTAAPALERNPHLQPLQQRIPAQEWTSRFYFVATMSGRWLRRRYMADVNNQLLSRCNPAVYADVLNGRSEELHSSDLIPEILVRCLLLIVDGRAHTQTACCTSGQLVGSIVLSRLSSIAHVIRECQLAELSWLQPNSWSEQNF